MQSIFIKKKNIKNQKQKKNIRKMKTQFLIFFPFFKIFLK
jgi:hypothetical protein